MKDMIDYNHNQFIKLPHFSCEEIAAAVTVLERGLYDALSINERFEQEVSNYMGVRYTLACCNGTMAMQEAMWACAVGEATEIIAPAMTYWASVYPAYILGATVKFVDINVETLCIDEKQIESCINGRTKAIIAVHLYGHPCNMDSIMEIAMKHNLYA